MTGVALKHCGTAQCSRYSLVAAGAAGRSMLAELPALRTELGPVVSSSIKSAGRIVRVLGGGQAVRDVSAVNSSRVVLACAPDTGFERVMAILQEPAVDWTGKILLFCDSGVSSPEYPLFQKRGASVGSLNAIAGLANSFVVEGNAEALHEAKHLVKSLGGRSIPVTFEGIDLFDAALTLATSLFTPLIDSCVECISQAGLPRKTAAHVAECLLLHALRSYMHAGRRGWSGPVAARDRGAVQRQYKALRRVSPLRAEYFQSSAEFAFALYKIFPELSRYLTKG